MNRRVMLVLTDPYGNKSTINALDGLGESLTDREAKMTYYYCYQALLTPGTCAITLRQPTEGEKGAIETAVEASLYYDEQGLQKLFWGDVLYYDSHVTEEGFPYVTVFLAQHDSFYQKEVSYSSPSAMDLPGAAKALLGVRRSQISLGYVSADLRNKAFIDGYTAYGKLTDEIQNLISGEDAAAFLQDGFLYLFGKQGNNGRLLLNLDETQGQWQPNDIGLVVKTRPKGYRLGTAYNVEGKEGEYVLVKIEGSGGNVGNSSFTALTLADRNRIQAGEFLFWG